LTKVALGHQKLRENINNLHGDEVRKMLFTYARDLTNLRDALSD
jgi:hypothetical protein